MSPCLPRLSHHSFLPSWDGRKVYNVERREITRVLLHPVFTVKLPQAAKSDYLNKPKELHIFFFIIIANDKKPKQNKDKKIDFRLRR